MPCKPFKSNGKQLISGFDFFYLVFYAPCATFFIILQLKRQMKGLISAHIAIFTYHILNYAKKDAGNKN